MGNFIIAGSSGSGKSCLSREIFRNFVGNSGQKYAFYFDLGTVSPGTEFTEYVTGQLRNLLTVPTNCVFDVFYYLVKTGIALCIFDGLDEMFTKLEYDEVVEAFAEISQVFTYESTVIITTRPSFLASSRYIRELLNAEALISERISQSATCVGIDPMQLPAFSIVYLQPIDIQQTDSWLLQKIRTLTPNLVKTTPLALDLAYKLTIDEVVTSLDIDENKFIESMLIHHYWLKQIDNTEPLLISRIYHYFAQSFRRSQRLFKLTALHAAFGESLFHNNVVAWETFRLQAMFTPITEESVKFLHRAYYEYCVAYSYISLPMLDISYAVNEQIRRFIIQISAKVENYGITCIPFETSKLEVPAGRYLLGDYDRAQVRILKKTVTLDEKPVTVAEYKAFLKVINAGKVILEQHPLQPSDTSLLINEHNLKIPDYLSNHNYDTYPIVCVSFWAAWAYARWQGKRLPTSTEWECAARGQDGRLFAWGDNFKIGMTNSADYWAGKLLINYEDWKNSFDLKKDLRPGNGLPSDKFSDNISPYGQKAMCGNVWEWTETAEFNSDRVVICGGSFDNVVRAVKASSKGIYRTGGESNAVGFRCCRDVLTGVDT